MERESGEHGESAQVGGERTSDGRAHFIILDGLRGIAALAVAAYHLPEVFGGRQWLPRGAVAVDFFFMLSGFVIACSYEQRLRARRLPPLQFVAARLIRLLPMAWVGLILGAVGFVVAGAVAAHGIAPFLTHLALGAALLPNPWPNPYSDNVLPLNWPSWSLAFELYAGTGLALVAPRVSTRLLAAAVVVLAAIYGASASAAGGANLGWTPWTIGPGLARFGYAFLLGWLFWRLRIDRIVPRTSVLPIALLLLAMLAVPAPPAWALAADLVAAMIVCPLVVALGSASVARGVAAPVSNRLGRLSYPLYAVHAPVYLLVGRCLGGGAGLLLGAGVAIVVAAAALLFYDEPLRRRARLAVSGVVS